VPDAELAINQGAIAPWRSAHTQYFTRMLEAVADEFGIDMNRKWSKLTDKQKAIVMNGAGDALMVKYKNRYGRVREYSTAYEGVVPWIKRRHESAETDTQREQFESYMREVPCKYWSMASTSVRSAICRSPSRHHSYQNLCWVIEIE
jgi:excinuclease ABC subunit A